MLLGLLTVSLWLAAADDGVSPHASAQQIQYGPAGSPDPPPDGGDGGDCDKTLPSTNLAQIDPLLSEFAQQAKITFNAPKEMQLEEIKTIQLVLSPTATFEELSQLLEETGQTLCASIVAGGLTQARLTAPHFNVYPITPETQRINPEGTTQWKWDIEPVQAGKDQKLHLALSVFVIDRGQTEQTKPRSMEVFDHTMEVNVSLGQRIANILNLGESPLVALATIVGAAAAVGGLLGAQVQKRRGNR
jgi:hypothetical protein